MPGRPAGWEVGGYWRHLEGCPEGGPCSLRPGRGDSPIPSDRPKGEEGNNLDSITRELPAWVGRGLALESDLEVTGLARGSWKGEDPEGLCSGGSKS